MSLDQIAQKLKSAREITGLSLAQIQEKTKIPYSHLASIDAANFDDLPEPVYVSGFIRRYAECVGLDPQELVDEYRSELDAASDQSEKTGKRFKRQKNNGNHMPPQAKQYNRQRIEKAPPNLFKLVPFYALWIILILVLIIYLVNRQGEIEQNQQDASLLTLKQSTSTIAAAKVIPPTVPEATPQPQTIPQPQTTTDNNPEETIAIANDTYRITLRAKNHVWVEVKAVSNGEALFNGFLESGDTHDFSDKEGLRIRAGNAGNVIVTAAGKTADLGLPGKIAEKIFSSNKVSQVAEGQTNESPGKPGAKKTISSTTANGQIANNAKKSGTENTITKKPVSENAVTKKPSVVNISSVKPHPVKENLPHEAIAPSNESNGQTSGNSKAIDVPYRYSE
jgi:cytoskeletal protein RodZ